MGKIKSAICITLFTLFIAALCFVCTVSFSYGENGMYAFNSILRMTAKDAELGGSYGAEGYLGGGYSVVYYPEGVISAKEYESNLGGIADEDDKAEYAEKYVADATKTLYFDKEKVCDGGNAPSESFKASFEKTSSLLKDRYSLLRKDGVQLKVADGYTVRVFLAKDVMDSELYAFTANSFTGKVTVRYGEADKPESAKTILPARADKPITDYLKKVSSRTAADGTAYVVLDFTSEGRKIIASETATANTMYFMVGENAVIPFKVTEAIDQSSLYLSGSYTAESAKVCATVMNSVLHDAQAEDLLTLTLADGYQHEALYGNNALTYLYIAFGVCFVGMAVFFLIRYRALAFAHIYTYLIFLIAMILCVWSIPFLYISVETFLAVALVSLLLGASNAYCFENAKKEYALGKTMTSSVKSGYKRSMLPLIDLHIVLAALSFIVYGIGLTNLSLFAFVLGLGTVFSCLCTIGLNRFMWAIMMAFTKNKGKFCNFKREEVEEDD